SLTYLGSIVTPTGGTVEDVVNRIKKANAIFVQLYSVSRNKCISRNNKLRIFKSNVKAVLLYGSETCLSNKVINNKLQTFIYRCLRRILNIHWPVIISNRNIHRLGNEELIELQIRRRKWRWIGHCLRKPTEAIEIHALEWNPQGSRSVGRPRGS
ncbi:hypothetical protein C0J52_25284, partial [Blattella germanica]